MSELAKSHGMTVEAFIAAVRKGDWITLEVNELEMLRLQCLISLYDIMSR